MLSVMARKHGGVGIRRLLAGVVVRREPELVRSDGDRSGLAWRLLVAGVIVLLATACDTAGSSQSTSLTAPATETSVEDEAAGEALSTWSGSWSHPDTTLGSNELVPRLFVTDGEVLVVFESNGGTRVAGERYDPETGEAARIASSGLVWRAGAAMVWTGSELLMVGGSNGPGFERIGAAYHPGSDSWRPLPDPPGRVDAWENAITGPAVWTGSEMLIYREGLGFDPVGDKWRPIASPPGPRRSFEVTIWTGSELIVWGGCDASIPQCDDFGEGILTDGFAYDPAADSWHELASSPLGPGVHPQGVWTGDEVLIYAGTASPQDGATAAAFHPATDSWRSLPDPPLAPRRYSTAAWTGQHFVLWGGSRLGTEHEFGDGAAYDPEKDVWLRLTEAPNGSERDRHAMVWVDDQLYITGGWRTNGPLVFEPGATN